MALHKDKFERMVHKSCPQSLFYKIPFTVDEMSYKVFTGDMLYPESQIKDLGIFIWLAMVNPYKYHVYSVHVLDQLPHGYLALLRPGKNHNGDYIQILGTQSS